MKLNTFILSLIIILFLAGQKSFAVTPARSNIDYLINVSTCTKGQVLDINDKDNYFFFNKEIKLLNPIKKEISILKSKADWMNDLKKNQENYNKMICGNKKDCKKIDTNSIKYVNNFLLSINMNFEINEDLHVFLSNLAKYQIILTKIDNKQQPSENMFQLYSTEYYDKKALISDYSKFSDANAYFNYLQNYNGHSKINLFIRNSRDKNKIIINYNCTVRFPSDNDSPELIKNYRLSIKK